MLIKDKNCQLKITISNEGLTMQRLGRMKHELTTLKATTMTGISVWQVEDNLFHLQAQILGGDESPYKGGVFKLEIRVPDRYPFEPPHVKFLTPIYHPNIDTGGRICLDVLKMPPKGSWKPSSNIRTVLLSVQLLMNDPNPDDPLMEDISRQYKSDRSLFRETAARWTRRHAMQMDATTDDAITTTTTTTTTTTSASSSKEDRKGNAHQPEVPKTTTERDAGKENHRSSSNVKEELFKKETKLVVGSAKTVVNPEVGPSSSSSSSFLSKKALTTRFSGSSSSKFSSSRPASKPSSTNAFDDFEDDDDDDDESSNEFVSKTPVKLHSRKKKEDDAEKKKKEGDNLKKNEEDGFSELNDSDLDLFDFEEDSPVKKKKKVG